MNKGLYNKGLYNKGLYIQFCEEKNANLFMRSTITAKSQNARKFTGKMYVTKVLGKYPKYLEK